MRQSRGENVTLSELLHARTRTWSGCLSIVELSWHHSVVGRLNIHRSDPLTWPRATISVTLSAFPNQLVLRGRSEELFENKSRQ